MREDIPLIEQTDIDITARSCLVDGSNESLGYGLYSYLLLNEPKDESDQERCLAAIKAYHARFVTVETVMRYNPPPRYRINVFYLLTKVTGPTTDELSEDETADDVIDFIAKQDRAAKLALANYDFSRAAFFIRRANLGTDDGPFIVSSLIPLSHGTPDEVLRQNLSEVPPRVMEGWFREFDRTVGNDREWNEAAVEQVVLDLRTLLSQAADILPEVQSQLAAWITFVKTQSG